MFNILTRLDPTRLVPSVCVSRSGGRLDGEIRALGIPLLQAPFTVPVRPLASLPLRAWRPAQAFRSGGYHIWHSFHYADDYSEPLIAWFSGAKKWVYTKKSMSWGSRGWLLRSYLASAIVADNSEMQAKFFDRPGLRSKATVIHHGLPLDQFSPAVPPRLNLRQQFGIQPGETVLGCVAQLVPVKGHPALIQAVQQLGGVNLLLAGSTADGEYTAKLMQLAGDCGVAGRVHFLGSVADIPALLAETDFFVLPTKTKGEGCPVALLEAMACGKACVATDIPGSRDLITHGENGLLVPPESPDALAGASRGLIDSPPARAAYGERARRTVEDHFSIEREVQAHEALYARLLERHG